MFAPMVFLMALPREDQPGPPEHRDPCAWRFEMRPAVKEVGEQQSSRSGQQKRLPCCRCGRGNRNEWNQPERTVAHAFKEPMPGEGHRIAVVIARRSDEKRTNDERVFSKKSITNPVRKTRGDIGQHVAQHSRGEHLEKCRTRGSLRGQGDRMAEAQRRKDQQRNQLDCFVDTGSRHRQQRSF